MSKLHKHSILQVLEIDAGHRLLHHEGKCRHLHGHRYKFHIHLNCEELDKVGRVIDFSVVKNKIGGWLDSNWDHGMILNENDPIIWELCHGKLHDHKIFLLPFNPSAENLASYLLKVANELMLEFGIKVNRVDCWETPNCRGTASL